MSKLTKTGKRCIIRLTELEELVVSLSIPGSARHSHCRGQGFDSPMLHKTKSPPFMGGDFRLCVQGEVDPCLDNAKHWRGAEQSGSPVGCSPQAKAMWKPGEQRSLPNGREGGRLLRT